MEVRSDSPDYLDATFAACERLAKTHYENFNVGSRLLPQPLRRHFYSIYAFSRGVDDLGDEASGDRLALLDMWEKQLDACYPESNASNTPPGPTHPFFVALAETIRIFDIPPEPFKRLIEANRRDQQIVRHETFDDVLEYCTYSANPVGHIVLYLGGIRDPELHALANHTCTALQLANFWQDVKRDSEIGRIYIPLEDLARFGVSEQQILDGESSDKFKSLMRFQVDRARQFFVNGYPLESSLEKHLKTDFALFMHGGLAILQAIERQNYDVLNTRPKLSKLQKVKIFASTWIRSKLGLTLIPPGAFRSGGAFKSSSAPDQEKRHTD
jgi:squalene synthase HpnC